MKTLFLSKLLVLSLFLHGARASASPRGDLPESIPPQVERIYQKGLSFLVSSQTEDGCWSDNYGKRPAVVALCILAFLAHGEDPHSGPYAETIKRSLDFLLKKANQANDGFIGPQMYDHGFVTLAFSELYGAIDDKRIAPALMACVKLILNAQKNNPHAGWRYSPTTTMADTTVSGCQIVALLAARNAGIRIPQDALDKALLYMRSCRNGSGHYGYTSRGSGSVTLTAIGSLCHSLAKQKKEKGYVLSAQFLKKNLTTQENNYPFYFRYYMSQALFHCDFHSWQEWNANNIRLLEVLQQADGSFIGNFGHSMSTSGALLSLALNYRLLPIYEK